MSTAARDRAQWKVVVGEVDLPGKRVWVRQPVVEFEGKLILNPSRKAVGTGQWLWGRSWPNCYVST